jgi:hypothetical protein
LPRRSDERIGSAGVTSFQEDHHGDQDFLPSTKPRKDEERDTQEAIIEDADKTEGKDRDLIHGDGGTIDLPVKPGDMSKDD